MKTNCCKYSESREQRQTKTEVFKFGYAETHPILWKYSESREQRQTKTEVFKFDYAETHPILSKYRDFLKKVCLCLLMILFPAILPAQSLSPDYLAYIEMYRETAVRQQQEYGIPASITLAQGLLESGAGQSRLATEGNNHFGIKCHNTWKGDGIYMDDDEKGECFRKYGDAAESFEDHARFLKRKRYEPLFDLKVTDYKGWAKGLKECGYATDPRYASKLISIIELYSLDEYDTGQPKIADRKHLEGDESLEHSIDMEIINEFKLTHKIRRKWGLYYVTAYDGDTPSDIADEFGVKERKLRSYNDLPRRGDLHFKDGDMVYLQEKNDEVAEGSATYTVREGDTLHSIAMRFGVKLESLANLNGMGKDAPLPAGTTLRLR